MSQKVFITFSIETIMDPDKESVHFDPNLITEILQVQPVQTQTYDTERKDSPRSRRPGNPWCSSWIYRLGGDYDEKLYSHQDSYIQFLLDQFTKQFIKPKKNLIIDILNQYNAICYLEVYLFCVKDYITHVSIPSTIMESLLAINCPVEIYTHSKPMDQYSRYEQKSMFSFE